MAVRYSEPETKVVEPVMNLCGDCNSYASTGAQSGHCKEMKVLVQTEPGKRGLLPSLRYKYQLSNCSKFVPIKA